MTKKRRDISEASTPDMRGLVENEEPIDDLDEALEVIPYNFTITAYGADYPVDSLVKRIKAGDIVVPRFSWEDEGSKVVGLTTLPAGVRLAPHEG
jgi:hypothetical protein